LLLRGFAFCASKGFRHSDEIVSLGFCNEPGESEQLAPLYLRKAREMRAIRFYCSQYSYGCAQVVV
jgi:hypothetical protein